MSIEKLARIAARMDEKRIDTLELSRNQVRELVEGTIDLLAELGRVAAERASALSNAKHSVDKLVEDFTEYIECEGRGACR